MIMRNKLFFLLVFSLAIGGLNAQTIHWITFTDTTDPYLGSDNARGKAALDGRFIARVNMALRQKGYSPKTYYFSGTNMSADKCNSVVNSLSVGPKDIVVFYYIGHGGRSINSSALASPWPNLEFRAGSKKYISLNTIHQRIKSKRPQLTLTIGMCCNVSKPSHDKSSGIVIQARGSKNVNNEFANQLQKLFLHYRGDIIVSAAYAGQEARGGLVYNGGEMDYFTGCLCSLMDQYSTSTSEITWANFLRQLADKTETMVKRHETDDNGKPYKQRPRYENNTTLINK